MNRISADPRDRMGVYKQLEDVPEHYRLTDYSTAYAGRDVWAEYVAAEIPDDRGDRYMEDTERVARRWKSHMDSSGRHHALARPVDVERWCRWLCERFSISHAYDPYWCRVESFYNYLLWHTSHPHVYNPFLMAAAAYPAAGTIWDEKTAALKWGVGNE